MNKKTPKTKKRIKRRLKIKKVFVLTLIVLAFLMLWKVLTKINVSSIEVVGNNLVSNTKIIKLANLNNKTSFLGTSEKTICKKIKVNELINTCKVKKEFFLKFKIIITENKPLFIYSYNDKLILSNANEIDKTTKYNVPTLINYVPEKILNKFISGLSDINSDIIHSISEIEYTPSANSDGTYIDEERFMLMMNDGNIVYINNRNISVLANYEKIYASIGDKKGYYNFDADYGNYYFEEFTS